MGVVIINKKKRTKDVNDFDFIYDTEFWVYKYICDSSITQSTSTLVNIIGKIHTKKTLQQFDTWYSQNKIDGYKDATWKCWSTYIENKYERYTSDGLEEFRRYLIHKSRMIKVPRNLMYYFLIPIYLSFCSTLIAQKATSTVQDSSELTSSSSVSSNISVDSTVSSNIDSLCELIQLIFIFSVLTVLLSSITIFIASCVQKMFKSAELQKAFYNDYIEIIELLIEKKKNININTITP